MDEIPTWKLKKDKYLSGDIEGRRAGYFCGSRFIPLNQIPTWDYTTKGSYISQSNNSPWEPNPNVNRKISLWKGDISLLETDAIVNAANSRLRGGGGVDGAICAAAGPELLEECRTITGGCPVGEAKIVGGYRLPAKYVIQTVGPTNKDPKLLASAYGNSLNLAIKHDIKSIAFPCIATNCYGFPNEAAAHVAMETTRKFLETDQHNVRVIFCVFTEKDDKIYRNLLPFYFPPDKHS